MTKKEKIERLAEISATLKKEFIGIDNVIDQIIESVTPWYITPELLERPIVISIWGLTGTGKTSVVRRLIDLLDYKDHSLIFDCGAEESTDNSISDKVSEFFTSSPGREYTRGTGQELNGIFLFDEFQYARTIDEEGREVSKAAQRSIWNLLDSGLIDIVSRPYEVKELMIFTEELDFLADDLGRDLKITKNTWPDSVMDKIHSTLDFYKTWRDEPEDEENKPKSQPVISRGKKEVLVNRLNASERGSGYKALEDIDKVETLEELIDLLKSYMKIIGQSKCIDCSRSLIFVIGNLDEAFSEVTNMDPDMDADVFAKIIKKTGILDVKEALKCRFRTEQIGRLGNNMVIYPSLKKEDFKKIIDKELLRIIRKFKSVSGITVIPKNSFKELLYSEGVYPSQGVRPVFTTIGSICLPKLSKILSDPEGPIEEVTLEVTGSFLSPEVTVRMTYDGGRKVVEIPETLELGKLRSRDACKKIAAHAIHEAGHAVMMILEKNHYPEMVLAQSSLGGGYTYESLDDPDKLSAMCKSEVDSEIRIDLGGICAEHIFFDDRHCTIGCTSDYQKAWELLSEAVYNGGFFGDPHPWADTCFPEDGVPKTGLTDDNLSRKSEVVQNMKNYMESMYYETTDILEEHKEFLRDLGKALIERRCLFSGDIQEIAESHGVSLKSTDPLDYWESIVYEKKEELNAPPLLHS